MSVTILSLASILILTLFGVYVAHVQWRNRPLRPPHGDWWPSFERQFRAYAARSSRDHQQTS